MFVFLTSNLLDMVAALYLRSQNRTSIGPMSKSPKLANCIQCTVGCVTPVAMLYIGAFARVSQSSIQSLAPYGTTMSTESKGFRAQTSTHWQIDTYSRIGLSISTSTQPHRRPRSACPSLLSTPRQMPEARSTQLLRTSGVHDAVSVQVWLVGIVFSWYFATLV